MIKIAFFDIDGTLLRFRHNDLSEPVRSALKQLQKQGILLCMATGRSYPFIPRFEGIEFGAYYSPSITTVRQPYEYMAEQAILMMRGLLDDEDNRHMVLNAEIVERESCAKRG